MKEKELLDIREALSKPSDIPNDFIPTGCAPRIEPMEFIEEKEKLNRRMVMKQISVDFEMRQHVTIKENGVIGKINGIWVDVSRTSYNVEWTTETNAIIDRWFVKDEIADPKVAQ